MTSLFLSASIPDTASDYYKQCDPMLIKAALCSFLDTVLGRKHIVFGGHPSISGLILAACEETGTNKEAVTIYQSSFFAGSIPKEFLQFAHFIATPAGPDLQTSLRIMRQHMLADHAYEAAVFIGGNGGILEEHQHFTRLHPGAKVLALKSPGGAAALIEAPVATDDDELLDYIGVFATGLNINFRQKRTLMLPEASKS